MKSSMVIDINNELADFLFSCFKALRENKESAANSINTVNFTLYMPETPIEQLSEDFLIWWPSWYYSEEETVRPEKLSCYGMCNEAMQYGFFSYEGMDVFEPYISR